MHASMKSTKIFIEIIMDIKVIHIITSLDLITRIT